MHVTHAHKSGGIGGLFNTKHNAAEVLITYTIGLPEVGAPILIVVEDLKRVENAVVQLFSSTGVQQGGAVLSINDNIITLTPTTDWVHATGSKIQILAIGDR